MNSISQLSHKTKFYLLIAAIVLICIMAYNFSISNTIDQFQQYQTKQTTLDSSSFAEKEIPKLQQKLAHIQTIIGSQNKPVEEVQQSLYDQIEIFTEHHDVFLTEVHPVHEYEKNGYRIYTHGFSVQSDFHTLQKLSKLLEDEFPYGHLAAYHYELHENRRTRKKYLLSTYYVQNIQ